MHLSHTAISRALRLVSGEHFPDTPLQGRHQIGFKPGVATQPQLITGRGVRRRYHIGQKLTPALHRFSHRAATRVREVILLCVVADQQGQLYIR